MLYEAREEARVDYDQARDELNSFKKLASQWTDFSNKIHKSESEHALIKKVRILNTFTFPRNVSSVT